MGGHKGGRGFGNGVVSFGEEATRGTVSKLKGKESLGRWSLQKIRGRTWRRLVGFATKKGMCKIAKRLIVKLVL